MATRPGATLPIWQKGFILQKILKIQFLLIHAKTTTIHSLHSPGNYQDHVRKIQAIHCRVLIFNLFFIILLFK